MIETPAKGSAMQAGDPASGVDADRWQALAPQARVIFILSGAMTALPAAIATRLLTRLFDLPLGWTAASAAAVLVGIIGAWVGWRRYRLTLWRLDLYAFSVRRGRLWQSDTRVPRNRVQHLDLRRGPLERYYGLATLIVHTAGTRDSSVALTGLAQADAEALRDVLARQSEHDLAAGDDPRNDAVQTHPLPPR